MVEVNAENLAETFTWIRDKYNSKGKRSLLLKWHIEQVCKSYSRLTIRMLFYRLVSRYGYDATKNFYKRVVYHSKIMRRVDSNLAAKFRDPTRQVIIPPFSYKKTVLFLEKDSIRTFLVPLLIKYRLSTLVLRGYGSLTAFQKALKRCKAKGTSLILFISDHDPSGLDLQRAAESEMNHQSKIRFVRLALTLDQAQRYRVPPRRVNKMDPRAADYISRFGDRCFEFEGLAPPRAKKLIEAGFRKYLPKEFLEEAKKKELGVSAARAITEPFRRKVERAAYKLARKGLTKTEIRQELRKLFGEKKS